MKPANINLTCTFTKFWHTATDPRKSSDWHTTTIFMILLGKTNHDSDWYTTTVITYLDGGSITVFMNKPIIIP